MKTNLTIDSQSTINQRIKNVRKTNKLNQEQFAKEIGLSRSTLAQIEIGKHLPTIEAISSIVRIYNISYNWLIDGSIVKTYTKEAPVNQLNESSVNYERNLPAITTVDEHGSNNIVMVDVKAAAGYVTRHLEPNYMQGLQAFKLPGPQFRNSTYRAFEVSGDSMFDTLYHGDWVICQHVDGFSNIRDGYIHVIVTHEEVMVKRLLNRVEKRKVLILQSDNDNYPARELDAAEVQEVWLVKCFMGFNMPNRRIEVKKVLNDIQVKLLEHESRMKRLEGKK